MPRRRAYKRRVREQVKSDLLAVGIPRWRQRALVVAMIGTALVVATQHLLGIPLASLKAIASALAGAIGGPILYGIGAWVVARRRAHRRVWESDQESLAKCRAEIDALKAHHPRLSACLGRDDWRVFLVITNDGAVADVSARISYSDSLNWADAAWDGRLDREYRMGNGDSGVIAIARKDSVFPEHWGVQYLANGRKEGVRIISRRQVAISVFSEPESLSPPIRCTLTLVSGAVEGLAGISWCPDASPTPPPTLHQTALLQSSETRQRLFSAVQATIELFYSVRDADEPSPPSWRAFKEMAQQAHRLAADDLAEPERGRIMPLLLALAEAEEATLDISCSADVAALAAWLPQQ
jgi:hypothetical protein